MTLIKDFVKKKIEKSERERARTELAFRIHTKEYGDSGKSCADNKG